MRKLLLLSFFILLIGSVVTAQKSMLIFYNDSAQQAIGIKKYGTVMIEYKGYLKQVELTTNIMVSLNDTSLVLAKPRIFGKPTEHRTIMLDDVTGFRKVSVGNQLLKTAIILGITVGSYFAISDNNNLDSLERVLYATTVGVGTTYGIRLIFPMNKPKHLLKDGWKMKVR